jgi:hypothetical protein
MVNDLKDKLTKKQKVKCYFSSLYFSGVVDSSFVLQEVDDLKRIASVTTSREVAATG